MRALYELPPSERAAVAHSFAMAGTKTDHKSAKRAWGLGKREPADFLATLARGATHNGTEDLARAARRLASMSTPSIAQSITINPAVHRAVTAALLATPRALLNTVLSDVERTELEHHIVDAMVPKAVQKLKAHWGLPPGGDSRELVAALRAPVTPPHDDTTPMTSATPRGGRRRKDYTWEPVEGKPHRRKRRKPNGKWHYENVPMQKAGETRARYLVRLLRHYLEN